MIIINTGNMLRTGSP